MKTDKNLGRIVGFLFLLVFINGIIIYQVLQGPVLFSDEFLTLTVQNANKIISSVLLQCGSGLMQIAVAILTLQIFNKVNKKLGFTYLALCILYFIMLAVDNISVLVLLEVSRAFVYETNITVDNVENISSIFYKNHWWTHYLSLTFSCLPAFTLYFILYAGKLIPKFISVFGMIAVLLMFIEMLFSLYDLSIGMYMIMPIALVQLVLPFWLIIKGLNSGTT